ncbi:MXAN_6640 family putative metalloprotease [Nocardioides perillae]|uniref:Neutral metalloprotease n=1 Tax=Nocardioides perillae TaxID=1119534 RepID=A0A7Y9ULS1_9ACTN|nr:MXAN_6640 family putative metalloprotease [Nocardioides perillae]NYG55377.1 hypothetical protein [Nocardioides perillae]
MRRSARTVATVLLVAALGAAALPAAADPGHPGHPGQPGGAGASPVLPVLPGSAAPAAEEALETATRVLEGDALPGDASPTVALRDLALALPALRGTDRREAEAALARPDARPTDPRDPVAPEGSAPYTTKPEVNCTKNVCVHHVTSGNDRPPAGWERTTLDVVQQVWDHHVGTLGYRAPLFDGARGGDRKFDVYLKDLGSLGGQGYYGYCAPEIPGGRRASAPRTAPGYCVLDDDFAKDEFGGVPLDTLRVTAAHEFFHAVQYAYDFAEDRWLLEATATWIEEQFADDVDDNRQYLFASQLRRPRTSLDFFDYGSSTPYGNWVFFEHLSQRFGRGVVKAVWRRAGDFRGAPDQHSTAAVRSVVAARKVAFPTLFAQYAAAGTVPAQSYSEGAAWPRTPVKGSWTLRLGKRGTGQVATRLAHLSSTSWDVRRGALPGRWRLLLRVDGPGRATSPAAHALVHLRGGEVQRRVVRLDRSGGARVRLPFHTGVTKVTVTLANASTRYRCGRGTEWSCRGVPLDDGARYRFSVYAVR